jgi:hypothetical protein
MTNINPIVFWYIFTPDISLGREVTPHFPLEHKIPRGVLNS